ncbi:PKD domain-containing protein [Methanococcoides orientis]|uniref:sugar-binding protein n=1 Tax=Methanococcoides orientis TaxID=2822137 RepID=UPI001E39AB04|nr:sugar-binding protein [Methanococcoides orientis]UGV40626.1 PKD domain-containing protein [Methanococcoides orientis]
MKKLKLLLMFSFISLIALPTAFGSTAPIVYVSTDGSGDYNCDGIKDEVEINAALQYVRDNADYNTVYLLDDGGANDYIIAGTIEIPDNTILTGDMGTTVKLVSNFIPPRSDWQMISGATAISGRGYKSSSNVTLSNLVIDADRWNQGNIASSDKDTYPTIEMRGKDLTFHDLSFTTGIGDFIKVVHSREKYPNLNIYDNYFGRSGHSAVYVLRAGSTGENRVWIHDNEFGYVAANAGIRLDECSGSLIENNTFTSNNQGDSAIYLIYDNDGSNIGLSDNEIRYNTISGVREYGIVLMASVDGDHIVDKPETTGNYIHHNLISNTEGDDGRAGGINIHGIDDVLIEYNTIVNCEGDGISTRRYSTINPTYTTGFTITARNNIISGMKIYQSAGYGINNVEDSKHTIISDYNNIYDNELGNYNNVAEGAHDIHDSTQTTIPDDPTIPEKPTTSVKPTASAGPDRTVSVGETVTLDGSASTDDVGIASYKWDYDNSNGIQQDATGVVVQHSYSSAGTYTVTLTVADGDGEVDTDAVLVTVRDTPSDIGNVNLDIVSGTATIDGDLTDWQYVAGTTISGVSDNTATVKAMYDSTYLYISYDVTDSNLQADGLTETSGLHLDDSVEIYLDTLHNAGSAMQADDYHFIINLNGAVVDDVGTGTGKDYSYTSNILNSVNLQGTKNDASADTGYIVEVAIPWSDIGGQPSSDISGLFLAVNDQDNTGTVYLLNWCDLTSSYSVPDLWGDATIAATSNTVPVMTPIDDRVVDEGNTVSFTVSASDAEDHLLTYSVSGLPSGASFDAISGVFSWTPSDVPTGDYGLVFEVTDGELTDSEAMIITVNAVNNDPLVNNLPVITALSPANDAVFEVGDVINIVVSASDADGQELNYLLKIDGHVVSTTSSYAWKPDLGTYTIEAVVSDGTDQVKAQHVLTVIKMHPRWDVNKDGVVNILDVTIVAQNLGTAKPHPSWDVNGDNEVNIQDLTIVAHYFGETYFEIQ